MGARRWLSGVLNRVPPATRSDGSIYGFRIVEQVSMIRNATVAPAIPPHIHPFRALLRVCPHGPNGHTGGICPHGGYEVLTKGLRTAYLGLPLDGSGRCSL